MKFKFQTSGQSIDNVPIIERTIVGDILKPPSPSDAKIFRDAQFNALIQWRRRGRINYHWRSSAGVPISEESEYYEIEALSGSTVVHTYRVPVSEAQSIQWNKFYRPDLFAVATDGTGSIYRAPDFVTDTAVAASVQPIDGNFVLEFESYYDSVSGQLLYLPSVGVDTVNDAAGGNFLGLIIDAGASPFISTESSPITLSVAVGDKFVLSYLDGVMRYYKNPTSDSSPVIYQEAVVAVQPPYWVRINCYLGGAQGHGIKNPKLLRFNTPDWTYTADMQTADGLTPGDPIHLKIYMVSATVGRGRPLDVTL